MHRRLSTNIVDGIVKSIDVVLAHRTAGPFASSTDHL